VVRPAALHDGPEGIEFDLGLLPDESSRQAGGRQGVLGMHRPAEHFGSKQSSAPDHSPSSRICTTRSTTRESKAACQVSTTSKGTTIGATSADRR
jgi:hypothetical protein